MSDLLAIILLTGALSKHNMAEHKCLAQNIYREARGESLAGQLAVAQVTINRVRHPKYPKTICKVVYQPNQFSWTRKYKKTEPDANSYRVASIALDGYHEMSDFKATHYHYVGIRPKWNLKYLGRIGDHMFYIS